MIIIIIKVKANTYKRQLQITVKLLENNNSHL
jgi:hypothetical protein